MIIDRHTGVRVARYQTHEGVRRNYLKPLNGRQRRCLKIHSSNQVHLANQTFYSVSSPGAPPGLNGVSPSDFPEHFFLSFFLAQQRNNGCFTHWNSFRCDSLWQSTPDGKINLWSKSKLQRHCQHAHIQQSAWTHHIHHHAHSQHDHVHHHDHGQHGHRHHHPHQGFPIRPAPAALSIPTIASRSRFSIPFLFSVCFISFTFLTIWLFDCSGSYSWGGWFCETVEVKEETPHSEIKKRHLTQRVEIDWFSRLWN